jgi:hypothetical protein
VSISIILIPAAIAAVSAWQASRPATDGTGRTVCHVQTRMRDDGLLVAALTDTKAIVTQSEGRIIAQWQSVQAEFARDAQGIWQVDMTGEVDQEIASGIVAAVDQAYGRQVQAAVLARLRERAPVAGMKVESERVEQDASVTLVLTVEAGA